MAADEELVQVMAAVNLPGLPYGTTAWVDPDLPQNAELLEHGFIVATGMASPADARVEIELAGHDAP